MHYIYYNLHKKLFSCKNWKTKLVEHREHNIFITNATFKVSEKGRQRVIKEERKNVHAGVLGKIECFAMPEYLPEDSMWFELTYNPYKYDSFVLKYTKKRVIGAKQVILRDRKIYAKGLKYE